jgi:hypothetical protein
VSGLEVLDGPFPVAFDAFIRKRAPGGDLVTEVRFENPYQVRIRRDGEVIQTTEVELSRERIVDVQVSP